MSVLEGRKELILLYCLFMLYLGGECEVKECCCCVGEEEINGVLEREGGK